MGYSVLSFCPRDRRTDEWNASLARHSFEPNVEFSMGCGVLVHEFTLLNRRIMENG